MCFVILNLFLNKNFPHFDFILQIQILCFKIKNYIHNQELKNYILPLWHFSTVDEGGEITNQDAADYLFSSDASHLDTKRYILS